MLAYPQSVLGYFVVGAIGALAFLFLMLLFDKNLAILENKYMRPVPMAILYLVMGGAVSTVVNVAASDSFGPGQMAVAFGAGFSWPALASGLGATRRVGELGEQREQLQQLLKDLERAKSLQTDKFEQIIAQQVGAIVAQKDGEIAQLKAQLGAAPLAKQKR